MAQACAECGNANSAGRFCTECGAALKEPVVADFSASADPAEGSDAVYSRANDPVGRAESAPVPSLAHAQSSATSAATAGDNPRRNTSAPLQRSLSQSQPIGLFKSRYSNHPNCDLCNISFDVTKRRHECRRCGSFVCNSCSPRKLLVPWGQQTEGARGYDKSLPQRVCLHCSAELQPLQAELVYHFARANQENPHKPVGGRFHLPYTSSLVTECQHAGDILSNFTCGKWGASADRVIPLAILEKAKGLAVLTVVKAGFMFVGKIGTGLVVSRLPDGSWSAPSAIGTVGLGWGLQIGGEIVEIVLVLSSDEAVQVFHKPQVNLGAGLDITVGPAGRAASAAGAVSSVGVNANFSYSHSKGLYAGLALQGAAIITRNDLNRKFYGRELEPSELLSGSAGQPAAAKPLYDALAQIDEALHEHHEVLAERAAMMGPCRDCECPTFVAHPTQMWNKKCKNCDHMH